MGDPQRSRSLLASLAAAGAVAFGVAGAVWPIVPLGFLLLLTAGGLLVLSWRYPRPALMGWVLVLLIAGTKFRIRDATASLAGEVDSQILLELGLYALLALALAVVWRSRRLRLGRLSWAEVVLLGYVALALASTLWSEAPILTLIRGLQLGVLYLGAVVLVRALPFDRLLPTLSAPLASYVLIFAGLAAVLPAASGRSIHEGIPRFSWFAVHPITAATLAGIAALILVLRLLTGPGRKYQSRQVWLWLAVLLLISIAVLTRSRGPLMALLGAIATGFMVRRLSGGAAAFLASVVVLGALVTANSGTSVIGLLDDWSADQGAVGSLVFRGQAAEAVAGFSGRMRLWQAAVPLVQEQPWLGRGFQGSRADLLELAFWSGHAHNAALQSLLDLGLAGSLLLFTAFASIAMVGPIRSRYLDPGIRLVRVTVVALGMFELLNAVSNQSFAGAPGFETLVVFTCICLSQHLRQWSGPKHSGRTATSARQVTTLQSRPGTYAGTAGTAFGTSSG